MERYTAFFLSKIIFPCKKDSNETNCMVKYSMRMIGVTNVTNRFCLVSEEKKNGYDRKVH